MQNFPPIHYKYHTVKHIPYMQIHKYIPMIKTFTYYLHYGGMFSLPVTVNAANFIIIINNNNRNNKSGSWTSVSVFVSNLVLICAIVTELQLLNWFKMVAAAILHCTGRKFWHRKYGSRALKVNFKMAAIATLDVVGSQIWRHLCLRGMIWVPRQNFGQIRAIVIKLCPLNWFQNVAAMALPPWIYFWYQFLSHGRFWVVAVCSCKFFINLSWTVAELLSSIKNSKFSCPPS